MARPKKNHEWDTAWNNYIEALDAVSEAFPRRNRSGRSMKQFTFIIREYRVSLTVIKKIDPDFTMFIRDEFMENT